MYNQPEYNWYVVDTAEGKIDSGWEYRKDAEDRVRELKSEGFHAGKVMGRPKFGMRPLDPDDDDNWATTPDGGNEGGDLIWDLSVKVEDLLADVIQLVEQGEGRDISEFASHVLASAKGSLEVLHGYVEDARKSVPR